MTLLGEAPQGAGKTSGNSVNHFLAASTDRSQIEKNKPL
jgi:hypothetical protein